MPANFNKPVTSDLRADVLQYIRDSLAAQAKLFDGETLTGTPTGAIRYSTASTQFEKWNGSTWAALSLGFLPLAGGTLTGALTGQNVLPDANNTRSLGSDAARYAAVHATEFREAGTALASKYAAAGHTHSYLPLAGGTLSGVLNTLNVLPESNNARVLGSDSFRWAGVYATEFYEAGAALASKYLSLGGGTLTGALAGTSANFTVGLTVGGVAVSLVGHGHSYLPLAGGTLSGGLSGTTASFSSTVSALAALELGHASDTTLSRLAAGRIAVEGVELGYRQVPISSNVTGTAAATDNGRCIPITSPITIPANVFSGGDAFSLYNDTAGSLTITQGASLTLRLAGSATTGNRTLAQRGQCTIWFRSATEAVIGGPGLT